MPRDDPKKGGTTLLFVHGFLDAGEIWAPVIERLATPGVHTMTLDLPGMGARGQAPGPFTLTRFAAEVREALSRLDGPVVLVGHSMGAQTAELVAMEQPAQLAGLVLIAPVPLAGAHLPADTLATFKTLGGDLEAQRGLRHDLMAFPARPETLERLTKLGAAVRPEAASQLVDAWNQGLELGGGRSPFAGPTLVATGVEDGFVTATLAAEGVARRYVLARAISIPQAGHWPHAEQPDAVAAALDTLLSELGRPEPADPAKGWTQAFADRSPTAFAQALAPEVTLEASVLVRPVVGRERVKTVLGEASKIYESLTFTHQAVEGERTYLEWEAAAFGGQTLRGVTVLTRDPAGAVVGIAIHHRPLRAALRFSSALRDRLKGVIGADFFHQDD
jgi:pimeloyl-ACP methyl ester carboxylesterase